MCWTFEELLPSSDFSFHVKLLVRLLVTHVEEGRLRMNWSAIEGIASAVGTRRARRLSRRCSGS